MLTRLLKPHHERQGMIETLDAQDCASQFVQWLESVLSKDKECSKYALPHTSVGPDGAYLQIFESSSVLWLFQVKLAHSFDLHHAVETTNPERLFSKAAGKTAQQMRSQAVKAIKDSKCKVVRAIISYPSDKVGKMITNQE